MRLFVDYEPNESGKGKFASRLIPELEKLGVKCQYEPKHCDVAISFVKWRTELKGMPRVLRVDGVHLYDVEKRVFRNKRIRNSIKDADFVIWQSNFSKRMAEGILKVKAKKDAVIYNGADPANYPDVRPSDGIKRVLMSGKWVSRDARDHKRLREMVNLGYEYTMANPDTEVHIAGDTGSIAAGPSRVVFHGTLPDEALRNLIGRCDCMLNLAWYDWCPNAVVESIVAGLPIVCGNGSGVEELVRLGGGEVVLIDTPLEPKMMKSDKPPALDLTSKVAVVEALHRTLDNTSRRPCPEVLHISKTAELYKKVFEEVLAHA